MEKKIQLHFLSKKLIHSCQRKRRVDIVIDIPFQYPWYLRSSSIIFAIKLSNRKSNEPRSYIIVSSFTFIERDKMSEWNLSYIQKNSSLHLRSTAIVIWFLSWNSQGQQNAFTDFLQNVRFNRYNAKTNRNWYWCIGVLLICTRCLLWVYDVFDI